LEGGRSPDAADKEEAASGKINGKLLSKELRKKEEKFSKGGESLQRGRQERLGGVL